MELVTLDFESYYDSEYSLSKMSTEDYVNDERFQTIGVGIKRGDGPAVFHTNETYPTDVEEALLEIDWSNTALLCHNTMFDGLILQEHYGHAPKLYLDTMLMARATVYQRTKSASLGRLAKALKAGQKGHEVVHAMGKRLQDFSQLELVSYGNYCRTDVELTYKIFKTLKPFFCYDEIMGIHQTLLMYLDPLIELDHDRLAAALRDCRTKKKELLRALPGDIDKKDLMSNAKMAKLLEEFGVDPPKKISPTTGKETWAFSKQDAAFTRLQDHPSLSVQAIMAARLGVKSTIEETRLERLLEISSSYDKLRVPLLYYGAHTGRYSGMEAINLQNLPKGGDIRYCLLPPENCSFVVADFSQIEARLVAWLAGQKDVLADFASGKDVYSRFAARVYEIPLDKIGRDKRLHGKVAVLGLGYQMGADRYRDTVRSWGGKIDQETAEFTVQAYRSLNNQIVNLWARMTALIGLMMNGAATTFMVDGETVFSTSFQRVELPNGLWLDYPNLRLGPEGPVFDAARGTYKLYGGKLTENITQALARIIMNAAMVRLGVRYPVVLSVHDELVLVVPDEEVDEAKAWVRETMVTPPTWAKELPLAAEVASGKNYGEAKP